MKSIRVGNDIVVRWRIYRYGKEYDVEQNKESISVILANMGEKKVITDYSVVDVNIIVFKFRAEDQGLGIYRLLLVDKSRNSTRIIEECNAFRIVSTANAADDEDTLESTVTITLTSELTAPADGLSAYEVALQNGFVGTEEEWLQSLLPDMTDIEQAEAQRQAKELERIASEAARESAESERQRASAAAVASANDAAASANAAKETANAAAGSANDAAANAEQKATLATEAASSASTAAEAAGTAAGRANEAADKFNAAIVQETGDSQDKAMSQKAVTDALTASNEKLSELEDVLGMSEADIQVEAETTVESKYIGPWNGAYSLLAGSELFRVAFYKVSGRVHIYIPKQSNSIALAYANRAGQIDGLFSSDEFKGTAGKPFSIDINNTDYEYVAVTYNIEGGNPIVTTKVLGNPKFVSVDEKIYTETEKEVARNNIDAASNNEVNAVRMQFGGIIDNWQDALYIDVDTWVSNKAYTGRIVPVNGGERFELAATESNVFFYSFIKEIGTSGSSVAFAKGSNWFKVLAGETAYAEAPLDAKFLYVSFTANNNPAHCKYVKMLSSVVSINDIDNLIKKIGTDLINKLQQSLYLDTDNTWKKVNGYEGLMVDISGVKNIKITCGSADGIYAVVKEAGNQGDSVSYASGCSRTHISSYSTVEINVPDDGRLLWVARIVNNIEVTPSAIITLPDSRSFLEYYDTSLFIQEDKQVQQNDTWLIGNRNYKGVIMECRGGEVLTLKGRELYGTCYSFLKSLDGMVTGSPVDYSEGTTRYNLKANRYEEVQVPSDAKYIWLYTYSEGKNIAPYIRYGNLYKYEQYVERLSEAGRKNRAVSSGYIPAFVFMHISDSHVKQNTPRYTANINMVFRLINDICGGNDEQGKVCRCLINTGDIHYDSPNDDIEHWTACVNKVNIPCLTVVGNHDVSQNKQIVNSINESQVYESMIAPYLESWELSTENPGTPHQSGKSYYFKDFVNEKIRLIVLCDYESDFETDDGISLKYYRSWVSYRQTQLDWLADSLNTCPNGYGVIIAKHTPVNITGNDVNDFNPETSKGKSNTMTYVNNDIIPTIVDAWMTRSQLSKSYSQTGNVVTTLNLNYDFSGANGEFVCYVNGHLHKDSVSFLKDFPTQLQLNISNNSIEDDDDNVKSNGINATLANACCVDSNSGTITIVRIGSCTTKVGSKRDIVQIKYRVVE